MSAFTMPLLSQRLDENHVGLSESDEQLTFTELAEWINVVPMYADLAAASEVANVHPIMHDFLGKKFKGLNLLTLPLVKGKVSEKALFDLGIPPSLITSDSRPDTVGVVKSGGDSVPIIIGEFRSSSSAVQVAVPQAFAYMCAAVLGLEHRAPDVPIKDIVVGGFVCNGYAIQFLRAFLIAEGFPSVSVVSHVIDLSSKMGIQLAKKHFANLEALVEKSAGLTFNRPDAEWMENPPNGYSSKSIHVHKGALRRPRYRNDVHASLRYYYLVLKRIQDLDVVHHPVGMVSGMALDGDSKETIHLCFRNLDHEGFSRELPTDETTLRSYAAALRGAMDAVHEREVVHGNLTEDHVYWKSLDGGKVLLRIVGWDESFCSCDANVTQELVATKWRGTPQYDWYLQHKDKGFSAMDDYFVCQVEESSSADATIRAQMEALSVIPSPLVGSEKSGLHSNNPTRKKSGIEH
ncbi:hypothetical protein AB1Y20_008596 [Prymnesium parvum]|uniref:Protein kinase domain-containing protein n=1 Tax=Prymnesium parvum TaxID=97485 RepID=A0AB34IU02_PRYPA